MRKPKDSGRPRRKKVNVLKDEDITFIDYKDINLLRKFMSERAKIRARRVNGNTPRQQREMSRAVKNAREMALLPYGNRVVQQRRGERSGGSRGGSRGGPRAAGGDRPVPKSPPPPPGRAPEASDENAPVTDAPAVETASSDEVKS